MAIDRVPERRTVEHEAPQTLQAAMLGLPLYPFRGKGVFVLIGGTIFLWVASLLQCLPIVGLFLQFLVIVYILAFFADIIGASANGDDELPGWPDATDFFSDLLHPAFLLVACGLVCVLPGTLLLIYFDHQPILGWVAFGLGAFYLPMAMLAVVLFNSVAALNPVTVISAIARIPVPYTCLVVVVAVVWVASFLLDALVSQTWPIVQWLVSGFLFIYEGALIMRATGVLYRHHAARIGWFHRSRNACRKCGYDLSGTPETTRAACPECGTPLSAIAAANQRDVRR